MQVGRNPEDKDFSVGFGTFVVPAGTFLLQVSQTCSDGR
jgi:hypothetical protein